MATPLRRIPTATWRLRRMILSNLTNRKKSSRLSSQNEPRK